MRPAVIGRVLRAWFRDPIGVFFAFVFPLLILVPLGLARKGEAVHGKTPYIVYSTSGVTAMAIGTAALFTGAFTVHRRERSGVPVQWGAEYATAVIVGFLQAVLITSCALLPSFGLHISGTWPLALPVIALAAAAFFTIGAVVGTAAKTPRGVATIAGAVMPLMAYLSGAFHPMPLLPAAVRTASWVLPLRYVVEESTNAISGRGSLAPVAAACAVLLATTALFGLLAARAGGAASTRTAAPPSLQPYETADLLLGQPSCYLDSRPTRKPTGSSSA